MRWAAGICLVMLVIATALVPGTTASADPGWSYRRPITITNNSGSALSDYQVLVELNTDNFDYSKANDDGSDLRFTNADNTVKYDYWIEKWNTSGTSKVWVKVPSIPAGDSTMYMWYGNSAASSESNGDNTFLFFDDFEDGTLDTNKWTVLKGTWSEQDGYVKTTEGDVGHILRSTYTGDDYAIETEVKAESGTHRTGGAATRIQDVNNYYRHYLRGAYSKIEIRRITSEQETTLAEATKTIHTYTRYRVTGAVYGDNRKLKVNGDEISGTSTVFDSGYAGLYGNGTIYFYWFAVRKYVETEPTTSVGNEEGAPADPVPELPTIMLLGVGLAILAGYLWLRRSKQQSIASS